MRVKGKKEKRKTALCDRGKEGPSEKPCEGVGSGRIGGPNSTKEIGQKKGKKRETHAKGRKKLKKSNDATNLKVKDNSGKENKTAEGC